MLHILARLAWRNISKHWRYSLGAFMSVAVGFVALTLFQEYIADVAYMYQDNYEHRAMYGHLLIEKNVPSEAAAEDPAVSLLDEADQKVVDAFLGRPDSHVRHVVRSLSGSGTISNGSTSTVFIAKGYDVDSGRAMRGEKWQWDTLGGPPLYSAETDDAVLLGKGLAGILECETPSVTGIFSPAGGYVAELRSFSCPEPSAQLGVTTIAGQSNSIDGTITGIVDGIFKEVDDRYVTMGLPLMQRLYDTTSVSSYAVALDDPAKVPMFLARFGKLVREHGLSVKATRWQDHDEGEIYRRTMDLLTIFRNFVVTIMIIIMGLAVFNTFLKSVVERTRELGTMRSLGYRRRDIVMTVALEAMFLSTAAATAGAAFALLSTSVINHLAIVYKAGILAAPVPFRIAYDPEIYLLSAVFLVAVAVLAATVAVSSTMRKKIAEALIDAH